MFRNFRHKKMQTVIIFLIIASTVLLLNGSVCILKSLENPMKEFAKECNSADIQAYPYYYDEELLKETESNLRSLDSVSKVNRIKTIYLSEGLDCNGVHSDAYSALAEYKDAVYKNMHVIKGNPDVSNYSATECAIPACISEEYGVKLGDWFTSVVDQTEVKYQVACIYSDIFDMSTAYDSRILVRRLPEAKQYNAVFYINTNNAEASKVVSEYRERYGDPNISVNSLSQVIDNNLLSANITGGAFLAIGIIMLLVSILIIYFIVKNAMLTDAKKVAIFKTLGYTYRQILSMYLRFYALIVGCAAAIGVVGSRVMAMKILDRMFLNMGKKSEVSVWFPGILTFLFTTVFVLLIIYLVLQQMKNLKPVYVLNGLSNRNTKKRREYKGNLTVAFSPVGIALRSFLRDKRGAVGIIITSMVTIFAINFAIVSIDIAYSMKEDNAFWFSFDPCDFVITVKGKEALEQAEKAVKGNTEVTSYNLNCINDQPKLVVEYEKGMTNTVIYPFVYDSYEGLDIPVVEGRNPKNRKEIAIGTLMAERLHKNIGDYMTVYLDPETKVDLLITGTFQTYINMGESARVIGEVYTNEKVDFCYNTISVYIKDDADRDEVMNNLKGKVLQADVFKYREDCYSSIMNMIAAPQKAGIPPVMVLVLVISTINIFSIVLLKNAVNKRTNQIYKSIGYSTKDLILSNMVYVGGIGLLAIVIAVPTLIVLYPKIMTLALSVFSLKQYPMNINYLHLLIGNALVLVLFLVSTVLSSRSIHKINVRDLVID